MEMDAIDEHFGPYNVSACSAVYAGIDILLYTVNDLPRQGFEGVVECLKNETINESRIDDSVRRILRKKKNSELDNRFSKLVLEFNMKIGDNATRGRGRPKKQDSNNVKDIKDNLESDNQNLDNDQKEDK